mmetsp:Transcript_19837/g.44134  ORF Transcript_19837/g.44134 Transcript_19837/m.44134 type:complete len:149 (+) Transcript_19837:45-491(+)
MDSLMVTQQLTFSTLVEIYLWWGFNIWWSFVYGGVSSSHTAQLLPSGGDFFSPTTAAVLTCPLWWSDGYWHRPVHTAMQLSKQVSYLLCIGPGFDPRDNHPGCNLAFFYFFYLQRRRSRGSVLIGCKHKHGVRVVCQAMKKYVLQLLL